jgi:CpXC protein
MFMAAVESVIDAGRDPSAKARLLSRRTNLVQCPNCHAVMQMSIPLVYHDHTKDLLLIYFPMELKLPPKERERMVGEMTQAVMRSLPQEERKGYLFNPLQPLTMDGMLETILEKDGITKEMLQAQREKMKLVETFMEADPADLATMAADHDEQLDGEFFQLISLSAENAMQAGRRDLAEAILERRDRLLEVSTYGQEVIERAQRQEQVIQEVAQSLQKMGGQMQLADFMDYVVDLGESDEHLQALVGLARAALDYNFFNELTHRIDTASDAQQKSFLQEMRDRLLELTEAIDAQQQQMIQQAQAVLQSIMRSEDMDAAIAQHLPLIDDLVLSVLSSQIQIFEQRGDLLNAARMKTLYEKIIQQVQKSSPPELLFINELLTMEDEIEANLTLSERANEYGPSLLDYMDAVIERFSDSQNGDRIVERLTELRDAAARIIEKA